MTRLRELNRTSIDVTPSRIERNWITVDATDAASTPDFALSDNASDFRPPWYLRSGHLQTILGPYAMRVRAVPSTTRHQAPLAIGDGKTYLYETKPTTNREPHTATNATAIMLIHGLGGHHASPYLTRISRDLAERGMHVFRVDLPGCGAAAKLSDRAAHAGCSPDLLAILRWASEQFQIKQWRIAGFSLGGNVTLKLLADMATDPSPETFGIERCVAVAPPVDLGACCHLIEQGFNRVYNQFFLKILNRYAEQRATVWPRWEAIVRSNRTRIRSIRDFDDVFTSRIAGFSDASDYYAQCSTHQKLNRIQVPTSILVDVNDPIVPSRLFDGIELSPFVRLRTTRFGGHLGYFYRVKQETVCWMDQWVVNQLT